MERTPFKTFNDELGWCLNNFDDYCTENIDKDKNLRGNKEDISVTKSNITDMIIVR